MKINVVNTEALKQFIKEEVTNVINENKACEKLSATPTQGEFFEIAGRRDLMSIIAACAYGSSRMWYKMANFYSKHYNDQDDVGEDIAPKAMKRGSRTGRHWTRNLRLGDRIYIPTVSELQSMRYEGNAEEVEGLKGLTNSQIIIDLSIAFDEIKKARDPNKELVRDYRNILNNLANDGRANIRKAFHTWKNENPGFYKKWLDSNGETKPDLTLPNDRK